MATKNYMINDKWLDLDKQNIVELQSVDGVLDSMKVNGSEIVTPSGNITITENGTDIDIAQYATADVNVEGGGGSSDFSTAEVTINPIIEGSPTLVEKGFVAEILYPEVSANPYAGGFDDFKGNIILYKNDAFISIDSLFASDSNETIYVASDNPIAPTISGDATYDNDTGRFIITGDCTITVTMVQGN